MKTIMFYFDKRMWDYSGKKASFFLKRTKVFYIFKKEHCKFQCFYNLSSWKNQD